MFGFCVVAGFRDDFLTADKVSAAALKFPHAPTDGVRHTRTPRASAAIARWTVVARDEQVEPSWDPARRLLFAGDVRLYNRPELIAELEPPPTPREHCDLELARLAYLRWGPETPSHLVGDFAFAVWDEGSSTLFAARDHLGVRPLYYRHTHDGIAVASDVRQLMELVERPADELSDEQVLDGLLRTPTDPRRSYFRSIVAVPPGHAIVVDAAGVREARYWTPPPPDPKPTYAEHCDQLRTLFVRAVRDRLESDRPLIAHSSGGFDSSTIVMAAEGIYRAETGRAPLTTVAAIAPGFPSDESRYIDAVAASVSFPCIRWNAVADAPLGPLRISRAAPVFRRGLAGGPQRDLEIARELGARVLLSGVFGDTVLHGTGVRRDMFRHGRWPQVAFDILRAGIGGQTLNRFLDAALGLLRPEQASGWGHRLLRPRLPPPEWMGPVLRSTYLRSLRLRPSRPVTNVTSHLWYSLFVNLTSPIAARGVTAFVEYASDSGIELRAPYLDVRLVDAILRIPWRLREPQGHLRRTGRDALGPLLPAAFSARVGQPPWTEVWAANARRKAAFVAPFIQGGPWLSAPFVDRGIARSMLAQVLEGRDQDRPQLSMLVSDFGVLEAWLRELFS
jgi:asparagine synthase (glutamine-hydrolysing)